MNSNFNRRNFLKTAGIGAISLLSIQKIIACSSENEATDPKIKLLPNQTILFQGDSITDSGRSFETQTENSYEGLGRGYPFITAADLLNKHADKQLKIFNRGISGNKVPQLIERWDRDCLDLQPDVLSIMIGVNDFWHKLDFGYTEGTLEYYESEYRKLLDITLKRYPNITLIIAEPFGIRSNVVNDRWFPEFESYQAVAKKIATDYKAFFIPLQNIFNEAQKIAPGSYWAPDGVHPSIAGAGLMAQAWLNLFE